MKRSQLREISMEVVVGAFMFMILLGLGYMTIVLSFQNIFTTHYAVEAKFDHVRGLRDGDNVFIRGVLVGRVKAIEVQRDGVRVEASLTQPVELREGYTIQIVPSSVLGGQHLAIDEGPLGAPLLPEGTVLVGITPVDIMDEATGMVQSIRKTLEEGEVLSNLERTMEQLAKITDDLAEGRGTIGRLMQDDTVYINLEEITTSLKEVSALLEKGEGSMGKFLRDDTIYDNVRQMSEDLAVVSGRLANGEGTLGRLLSEDDALYEDISEAAAAIRKIATTISEGEGTVGRLIHDDDIYEDAKLLIHEIRATIDDFRETAPITTFTSIFFGAF